MARMCAGSVHYHSLSDKATVGLEWGPLPQ